MHIKVEYIPTGFIAKRRNLIKILNRFVEFKVQKEGEVFPSFKFFNITIKNKKSKTFDYFMNLYIKKEKIESIKSAGSSSYKGGKEKLHYSGTIYGMSVIGFDGDDVKLQCDYFDRV